MFDVEEGEDLTAAERERKNRIRKGQLARERARLIDQLPVGMSDHQAGEAGAAGASGSARRTSIGGRSKQTNPAGQPIKAATRSEATKRKSISDSNDAAKKGSLLRNRRGGMR